MNQSAKEIYDEYTYKLLKLKLQIEHSPESFANLESFEKLSKQVDKLDALIDLYAYLLVNHS